MQSSQSVQSALDWEWDVQDSIGVLTLTNPPRNSLKSPELLNMSVLQDWIESSELRGLIIQGKGRHFSSGAEIDHLFHSEMTEENLLSQISRGRKVLEYLEALPIPTISAISGVCFGGGLEIALSTHIRIASEGSLFAFPEVNLNLIPGLNGTVRLPGLTGLGKGLLFILSGDIIDTEKAKKIGVVDSIVAKGESLDTAVRMINKMTDGRLPSVIQAVVRSMHNAMTMSMDEAMEEESRTFCRLAIEEMKRRNGGVV